MGEYLYVGDKVYERHGDHEHSRVCTATSNVDAERIAAALNATRYVRTATLAALDLGRTFQLIGERAEAAMVTAAERAALADAASDVEAGMGG